MIWYNGRLGDHAGWWVSNRNNWYIKYYGYAWMKTNDLAECPHLAKDWKEWDETHDWRESIFWFSMLTYPVLFY